MKEKKNEVEQMETSKLEMEQMEQEQVVDIDKVPIIFLRLEKICS